jgi:hypothetical protein
VEAQWMISKVRSLYMQSVCTFPSTCAFGEALQFFRAKHAGACFPAPWKWDMAVEQCVGPIKSRTAGWF